MYWCQSPIVLLWTTVMKPWVCYNGCLHLGSFEASSGHMWMRLTEKHEDMAWETWATCHSQGSPIHKQILLYLLLHSEQDHILTKLTLCCIEEDFKQVIETIDSLGLFTEVKKSSEKQGHFLISYQAAFCNRWSHPMLAIRKGEVLRHFCLGFIFQTLRLSRCFIQSVEQIWEWHTS